MTKGVPSMDDKNTPSPPTRTQAQYDADKAAGINPYGKPYDRIAWELHAAACKEAGLDPEEAPPHYHEKVAREQNNEEENSQGVGSNES